MQRVTTYALVAFVILAVPSVAGDEVRLIDLESVGIPAAPGIEPNGREINDLFLFEGKLWVGCGDATDNTGPTPIYCADPATGEVTSDFAVDDEGIYSFSVLSGKLAVPGYDAMEPWDWGNLYVRDGGAWKKLRTLPRAVHVQDVCEFSGAWIAGIGSSVEFAEKQPIGVGTIQFSADGGASWRTIWSTPGDHLSHWRVGSVLTFRGALYAFPFSYGMRQPATIPERYRAGIGELVQGMAYLYRPDPLGAADAVRFDGRGWRLVDLMPMAQVARVQPFLFGDRLLISARHGEYIGSGSRYVTEKRALPPGTTSALHAFDGEKTTRVPLEYDAIQDAVARDGTLRLLVLARGQYWIVETEDLETFHWLALPFARATPMAIEFVDGVYWVGAQDGNLYRSTGSRELPSPDAVAGEAPRTIHAAGDLPINARAGWLAVTRLARPWVEASVKGAIEKGKAHVTTADTDAFRLFPPRSALGEGGKLALGVDGAAVFDGSIGPGQSLKCSRREGRWTAEVVELTIDDYRPEPQVVGECKQPLAPPALAQWAAETLLTAEGCGCVLLPVSQFKRPMPAGPVTSRAFLDLMHRSRIAVYRVSGEELQAMLAFNETAPQRRRLVAARKAKLHDPPMPREAVGGERLGESQRVAGDTATDARELGPAPIARVPSVSVTLPRTQTESGFVGERQRAPHPPDRPAGHPQRARCRSSLPDEDGPRRAGAIDSEPHLRGREVALPIADGFPRVVLAALRDEEPPVVREGADSHLLPLDLQEDVAREGVRHIGVDGEISAAGREHQRRRRDSDLERNRSAHDKGQNTHMKGHP
ncbi:MAG: hypothetical protein ACYTGV_02665 [Planctomycetota bacterium]|jgi:hypothetical protein